MAMVMAVSMIAVRFERVGRRSNARIGSRVSVCRRTGSVVSVREMTRRDVCLTVRRHRCPTELKRQQGKQHDDHQAAHGREFIDSSKGDAALSPKSSWAVRVHHERPAGMILRTRLVTERKTS